MSKKIALISNSGISLILFRKELIEELKKAGYEIITLAPDYDVYTYNYLKNQKIIPVLYSLSRTGINPIIEVNSLISLLLKLKYLKPDIVLCFQIKTSIYGSIASILNGIKYIYIMIEGLGYVFTIDNLINYLIRTIIIIFFKILFVKAKKVFVLNPDDEKEFIKHDIVKKEKLLMLGGIGVNLNDWLPKAKSINEISFIFVGRLLREKGIFEYIEAARILKNRYPYVRFIVVGQSGKGKRYISEKIINKYVSEGILDWPGFVNVKEWLAKADVFVLPSYREGIPRSAQEALAMGKPIITTDAPGCKETVIDRLNGFKVKVRDIQELCNAMEKFILNPKLIEQMGLESRKLAEKKFDVNKINSLIIEIIKKTFERISM